MKRLWLYSWMCSAAPITVTPCRTEPLSHHREMKSILVAILAFSVLAAPACGASRDSGFFKTPSGNIVCLYGYGKDLNPPFLECGIKSGLKPAPPRTSPACKHLDYVGNRIGLTATGRPQPIACTGDAGPFANPAGTHVLAYTTTWRGGGFICTSRRTGLTCKNNRNHGFFLSRNSWHRF